MKNAFSTSDGFDHDGFWRHVFRHIARCPGLIEVAAIYFAFVDPETPAWVKPILGSVLLYFIVPLDAIPDWILIGGFVDDFAVVAAGLSGFAGSFVQEKHRQQARDLFGLI